jgi:serine protease Do
VLKKILVCWLIVLATISFAYADLPDFTDLVEEVSPAVVKINTLTVAKRQSQEQQLPDIFRDLFEQRGRPREQVQPVRSSGSGFVISRDGYILTNHHVVDQAEEIQVLFADRSEYQATIVGTDRRSDLALLKIEAKGLKPLVFADSEALQVGEWVLAIGSPFGLDYSVTAGIVSAIGRSIPNRQRENYVPFIQTDVAINPGNSGGPLFNLEGEVVGINSQIFSRSGGSIGLSFSIPSAVAQNVVAQLKKSGSVKRGWLGVAIQDINKSLAESLRLDKPQGALINTVEPEGPAELAGIEPGDVIITFGGQTIVDADDLPHVVGMMAPNSEVRVQIVREGKRKTIDVVIGTLDDDRLAMAGSTDSAADRLGLKVDEVSPEQLKSLRIRGGVNVAAIAPDSAAAEAGLMPDDVIVQLGYSRIDDVDEYRNVIAELPNKMPILIRFYRQGWAVSRTIIID